MGRTEPPGGVSPAAGAGRRRVGGAAGGLVCSGNVLRVGGRGRVKGWVRFQIRRQPGQQHARRRGNLAVVLGQEGPEQLRGILKAQARPVEGPAVGHGAVAHKNQGQRQTAFAGGQAQGVHIAAAGQHCGLTFHSALHGADLVAQQRGAFKFQRLGGGFHARAQMVQQFRRAPFQQIADLAHVDVVFLWRDQTHAGGRTLAHEVVEAGAHAVFHGPVRAAAQGKGPVQQLPGFARGQGRSEGAEVARAVPPGLAHDLQAGKGVARVAAKQHVLLVVAQHDIVVGTVLFDQARFQQQGLFFRGGGEVVQAGGVGKHGPRFGGQPFGAEVGEHPPPQYAGFAT